MSTVSWTEEQFENWFIKHPDSLRGKGQYGETLLFINKSKPLQREEDLLAIDGQSRLVLIEVKRTKGDHHGFGQLLEYVSAYEGVTIEELEERHFNQKKNNQTIKELFKKSFGTELAELSPQRIAILMAPEPKTSGHRFLTRFLSESLKPKQVMVFIAKIELSDKRFVAPRFYKTDDVVLSRNVNGFGARNRHKDRFFVLDPGPQPVVWNVGTVDDISNDLLLLRGDQFKYKTIETMDRAAVIQLGSDSHPSVDVALSGMKYESRQDPAQRLKVIGRVGDEMIVARFKNTGFQGYAKVKVADFESQWVPTEQELPGWREIVKSFRPHKKKRGKK
jgi:hypothetical protein